MFYRWNINIIILLLLTGCATINPETGTRNYDPWERTNRDLYSYNLGLDQVLLKPAATGYSHITSSTVRRAVANFFDNLGYIDTILNGFLQGKFKQSFSDITRFVVNSTFGIVGFFDLASEMGLEKHKEDFGQTLGVWGVKQGNYMMLPLLGPSSTRDVFGIPVSQATNVLFFITNSTITLPLTALKVVNQRAQMASMMELPDQITDDSYTLVREGYLQKREVQVHGQEKIQQQQMEQDINSGLFEDLK